MRAITYLSPGIPLDFYERLVRHMSTALGRPIELVADPRCSGPPVGEPNPLSTGGADIAFVCGPAYLRLVDEVQLVCAAPVFDDPRTPGRPLYFAEVVVTADHHGESLAELVDARYAYNDPASLSGFLAVLAHLGSATPEQFSGAIQSGSSEASLDLLDTGKADICSVDSVVWRRLTAERPELLKRFRVMESLGPFPVQPIVASPQLDAETLDRLTGALLRLGPDDLGPFGASGFVSVGPADYRPLAAFLARL